MSEWGPWIEHDGKGCPCIGMYVEVDHDFGDGLILPRVTGRRGWNGNVLECNVIRYRIRKPRGLTILQEIIENLPAPTKEQQNA